VQEGLLYLYCLTKQLQKLCTVILAQFFPELTEEDSGWFQQDSAPAHAARISMQAFSDVFGDKIISNGIWPARSPYINSFDFSSWVV
jgi:hypothetical protein